MISLVGHLLTVACAQPFSCLKSLSQDHWLLMALESGRISRCLASMGSLKPSSLHLPFQMQILSTSGQDVVFPALAGTWGPDCAP